MLTSAYITNYISPPAFINTKIEKVILIINQNIHDIFVSLTSMSGIREPLMHLPVHVNPKGGQADPRNSDTEKVCLLQSSPCH